MVHALDHFVCRQVFKGTRHMRHLVAAAGKFFAEGEPYLFDRASKERRDGQKCTLNDSDAHGGGLLNGRCCLVDQHRELSGEGFRRMRNFKASLEGLRGGVSHGVTRSGLQIEPALE